MTTVADALSSLGAASFGAVWLPLLAWSAVAMAVWGMLSAWRRAHPQIQFAARAALLLALPLGMLLGTTLELSLLDFFPSAAPTVALEPWMAAEAMPEALTAAPASGWDVSHTAGLMTLLALGLALFHTGRLFAETLGLLRLALRLRGHTSPEAQKLSDTLAKALGLRRRVRVVVTRRVTVPMTLGWRRPLVMLPGVIADDEETLRMALLHELIHVRRHDFAIRWAGRLIGAAFAIHPLVGVLLRSLDFYSESACDAEVLAQPRVSGKRYATLLFSFAVPGAVSGPFAVSMAAPESQLKRRILAMNHSATPARPNGAPRFLSLALSGLLLVGTTLLVACTEVVTPETSSEAPAAKQSSDVHTDVDEMPKPIGGLAAIQKAVRYPKEASARGLEGKVIVEFVVDEQGRVVEPRVVQGLGSGLDEAALRAVREVTFTPARKDGKAVRTKLTLPFTFRAEDQERAAEPQTEAASAQMKYLKQELATVYEEVDQMPKLIGGLSALQQAIQYPTQARQAGIEGRVVVAFVVDEDGRVTEAAIATIDLQGRGAEATAASSVGEGGLGEEALRAVETLTFEPGLKDGVPVKVKMAVPVSFRLAAED